MRSATLIAGAATLALALSATAWADQQPGPAAPAAPAARPAPPVVTGTVDSLPADLKPLRVAGAGLNVNDLAAQRAWYEKVLGMKLQASFPAGSATPTEFVMSMNSADPNAAVVALLHAPRQPGATTFGRIIMIVPDADKAAAFLLTHGVSARKVSAGAYFAQDPEGNNIELYTPPAPGK
jgi:catechol 2,3-dioxygenase-like lactoylglutathione lyase family enzyme